MTPLNIVQYWRNSLLDAERMAFGPDKLKSGQAVSTSAIATGTIDREIAAAIFNDHISTNHSSTGKRAQQPEAGIEIIICPLIAKQRSHRGYTSASFGDAITPLWIPAILNASGTLTPNPGVLPWIARNVLEPVDRPSVILGSVDDQDRFLASYPSLTDKSRWLDVWSYARQMLQQVTGMHLEHFQLADYEIVKDTAYILAADTVQGSGQHILRLYDNIIQSNNLQPLLARYASLEKGTIQPLLEGSRLWEAAELHTGQMRSKFPLSPSQREALHHFLTSGDGQILAVNGPPGTGKTTLIQSVVATMWVNAALRGGEPPVILAASTNNQAVTNIIQSFAMNLDPGEQMVTRWIPQAHSFGLYCVSKGKAEEAAKAGYQTEYVDGEKQKAGFFPGIENATAHRIANSTFLDRCSAFFGQRIPDVEQASELLRIRLADTIKRIREGTRAWGAFRDAQRNLLDQYSEHGSPEAYIEAQQREHAAIQTELQQLKQIKEDWQKRSRRFGWVWPLIPNSDDSLWYGNVRPPMKVGLRLDNLRLLA